MVLAKNNPVPLPCGNRIFGDIPRQLNNSESIESVPLPPEVGGDLAAEWRTAATEATRADFDALVTRGGVPKAWLWAGAMRFGVTSIYTCADGTYEPNPDGRPAFIVPAAPVPEETLFEDNDPEDLIAFTLTAPSPTA